MDVWLTCGRRRWRLWLIELVYQVVEVVVVLMETLFPSTGIIS